MCQVGEVGGPQRNVRRLDQREAGKWNKLSPRWIVAIAERLAHTFNRSDLMYSRWLLGIATLVLLQESASKAYSDSPSLYYSATVGGVKSIYRSTLDGSNATVVLTGATGPFDIDDRTGTIYFEAPSSRTPSTESIWKSNIDGSNRVEFIQNCCLPSRIEIDESNNRLFLAYFRGSEWNLSAPAYIDLGFRTTVEIEFDQIHQTAFLAVGRYAGTGLTDEVYARTDDGVVTPIVTGIRNLNGLGIDPVHQFVYFSAQPIDGSDPRAIYRVRMDGGSMAALYRPVRSTWDLHSIRY